MRNYIEIPADNVIMESKQEYDGIMDIPYIIYLSPDDVRWKIRINTYYLPQGATVKICVHYDRGLCKTMEEYNCLPISYIEEQAYGAWMDGAR